jgi:hypothetical protein
MIYVAILSGSSIPYLALSFFLGPLPRNSLSLMRVQMAVGVGLAALSAVNTGLFMLVVLSLLSLGLMRSFKQGKWMV